MLAQNSFKGWEKVHHSQGVRLNGSVIHDGRPGHIVHAAYLDVYRTQCMTYLFISRNKLFGVIQFSFDRTR